MIIKTNVKLALGMNATFIKHSAKDPFADKIEYETEENKSSIQTKQTPVYSKEKVESVVNNLIDQLDELYETFKHKSSGWALKKIMYI